MPMAPEPTTSSDFGICLRHHRLEIGPHQPAVRLEARQHARPRAGRDDDVLGLIGAGAERAFRRGMRRLHRRLRRRTRPSLGPALSITASPQMTLDLVLLEQEADAVVEALRDAARAIDDRRRDPPSMVPSRRRP